MQKSWEYQEAAQAAMNEAVETYLALTDPLLDDVTDLMKSEVDSSSWRRNYIRAFTALVEGYAHCFRAMASVGLSFEGPVLTEREKAVLRDERGEDTADRIRVTLRAAYKMFALSPMPDFGVEEWKKTVKLLSKRHALMHPKKASDLEVSNDEWVELEAGARWILRQLFGFTDLLQAKYR